MSGECCSSAKSYVEGSLALCLYAARLIDDAKAKWCRAQAQALVDLLTPIVKAWPSDYALEANSIAIQVHGGAGYTRDFPVERLWRENRINAIHEGTNGIQAMDLLGRKLLGDGGKSFRNADRPRRSNARHRQPARALSPLADILAARWDKSRPGHPAAGKTAQTDLELALANAYLLLDALGHAVVAWLWLDQAVWAELHLPPKVQRITSRPAARKAGRRALLHPLGTARQRQAAGTVRRSRSTVPRSEPRCCRTHLINDLC